VKLERQIEYRSVELIFDEHANPVKGGDAAGLEVGGRKRDHGKINKILGNCFLG
jgi:hypothetical protein